MEARMLLSRWQNETIAEGSSVTNIRDWISRNSLVLKIMLVVFAIIEAVEAFRLWFSVSE